MRDAVDDFLLCVHGDLLGSRRTLGIPPRVVRSGGRCLVLNARTPSDAPQLASRASSYDGRAKRPDTGPSSVSIMSKPAVTQDDRIRPSESLRAWRIRLLPLIATLGGRRTAWTPAALERPTARRLVETTVSPTAAALGRPPGDGALVGLQSQGAVRAVGVKARGPPIRAGWGGRPEFPALPRARPRGAIIPLLWERPARRA